jgi:hypothetical protein
MIEHLVLGYKAPALAAAKLHSISQKGNASVMKNATPADFWMSEKS